VRVIAGSAKGSRLRVVDGPGLRPTGDRQRETLFNVIQGLVADARVVDVFAGSGALGIEALSRGATSCVFIERNRKAAAAIEFNLEHCHLDNRGRVETADWRVGLRRLAGAGEQFDLLLADPPWADDAVAGWLGSLASVAAPEALLCLERRVGTEVPASNDWHAVRVLSVGDTAFHFMDRIVPTDGDC